MKDQEKSQEKNQDKEQDELYQKEARYQKEFNPYKNPPKLILVQGPPKSGKTTLIKSLIKHYTNQVFEPVGPITIRVSQKQRITLYECSNEMSEIVDLCKIPDLVLMTVDASLGFEMQTFEALTIMQNHSFPRCIGVVNHLDYFKNQTQVKKAKKQLKKRFSVEVTEETRLFFVSSLQKSFYNQRDMHNLAWLISVINPWQTEFRQQHPYLLIDWIESLDQQRTSFYGYLRGNSFNINNEIFVSGFGIVKEFKIEQISDPCPLTVYDPNNWSLRKREKLIHAPQSQVSQCIFDKDGDYITIPKQHVVFTQQKEEEDFIKENKGVQMIREIQQGKNLVDQKLNQEIFLLDQIPLQNVEEKKEENFNSVERKIQEVNLLTEKMNWEEKFFQQEKQQRKNIMDQVYENEGDYEEIKDEVSEDKIKEKINEMFHQEIDEENSESEFEVINQENQQEEFEPEIQEQENSNQIPIGKYVKIILENLKENQVQKMLEKSLIISQTFQGETNKGFLLIKFKRQKWFQGLLKSQDPVVVSTGLYKYQTIPVFCQKDEGGRLRFLKYTLKFEHCYAVIYGNYVPINSGISFFKNIKKDQQKFRIGGTGIVIGFSQHYEIKKKLKLLGEPLKIFRKTALVKNMFNSNLEVQKFIGAKIKTVSGIRGQIKGVVKGQEEGVFWAHFEDMILMSDLVFCWSWATVPLEQYYNPLVCDLNKEKQLLKTTKELREINNIEIPQEIVNKEVKWADKVFSPFVLPGKIKQILPFKTKEKSLQKNLSDLLKEKEEKVVGKMKSTSEKESEFLINRLKELQKQKDKEERLKKQEKRNWKEAWEKGMSKKFERKKAIGKKRFNKN